MAGMRRYVSTQVVGERVIKDFFKEVSWPCVECRCRCRCTAALCRGGPEVQLRWSRRSEAAEPVCNADLLF